MVSLISILSTDTKYKKKNKDSGNIYAESTVAKEDLASEGNADKRRL